MEDSNQPSFHLEGSELLAAALHAQLLARRRGTFEHDLKNVVHGLLSGMELMGKALTANPSRIAPSECLRLLQQQLGRTQHTLNQLLDEIAPSQAGTRDVELRQLVEECEHDLRHQLQRVHYRSSLEANLVVRAHRPWLKNALLSVLIELLDQTPPSSTLTVLLQRENAGRALVEIRHGIAQPPISAALSIVELILPETARIDVTDVSGERRIALTLALAADSTELRTGNAGSIMIVDGNRDAADTAVMLLELEGLHAISAYDVESALRAAQEHPPRAIVVDIDGSFDSAALIARLRMELPHSKILALSHGVEPGAVAVDAYLRKPLEPHALRAVLETPS